VVVLRYELRDVPGSNVISMRKGATILTAQYHPARGCISLWVVVDEQKNSERNVDEKREFFVASTGDFFLDEDRGYDINYIGTCQESQGALVWHVFERLKPL